MLFLEKQPWYLDTFSWQHPYDDNPTNTCLWGKLIMPRTTCFCLGWEGLSGLEGRQVRFASSRLAMLALLSEDVG